MDGGQSRVSSFSEPLNITLIARDIDVEEKF